ncbi:transporter substrate-binding domain-containing protein, partial [Phascolarctobacterium succinatutens]|uniref:transporter substrate-binding domain-containing protein n=1 Tax=Phascolarctobacterium succinatutens TaxID=626940 RepID=UPI0026ECEFA5
MLVLCVLSFGCGLQDSSKPAIQPQQKELVFAGDIYPPFTYMDIHGNMAGIDIELMQEACRRLGYKSTYKVIPWKNKDKMLGSGEVDAVW